MGALSNIPAPFIVALLATGIFIADRVNKLPMVLAFLGAYLLLFTGVAFVGNGGGVAEIFRAPDITAALFFAFFMLTDPPTSPARYRDQLIFGVLVAVASTAIYLTVGALYFLPAGLLIGNGWEAWRRTRSRTRKAAPASAVAKQARLVLAPEGDGRRERPATGQRVLIVERTDYWARTFGPHLARAGALVAAVPPTALAERVRVTRPEAVLIDMADTGMDGLAACRAIRRASAVPIVAIARYGDAAMMFAALDAGADDCQAMPVNPDELLARLRAVGRRSAIPLGSRQRRADRAPAMAAAR